MGIMLFFKLFTSWTSYFSNNVGLFYQIQQFFPSIVAFISILSPFYFCLHLHLHIVLYNFSDNFLLWAGILPFFISALLVFHLCLFGIFQICVQLLQFFSKLLTFLVSIFLLFFISIEVSSLSLFPSSYSAWYIYV